jgi:signal transduction histidine kinase/ligand-binding sensor domain-containing protein
VYFNKHKSARISTRQCARGVLLFVCLWLGAIPLFGVQPYTPVIADPVLESWRWQRLHELEGRMPACMATDAKGALWFGYSDGLAKYDGARWETFSATNGVPGPVHAIAISKSNEAYAATDVGVIRFTDGRWSRVFPSGTNTFSTHKLLAASDGSIWAAGVGVIIRISATNSIAYHRANLGPVTSRILSNETAVVVPHVRMRGNLEAMKQTRDGAIWFAFGTGELHRYDFIGDPAHSNSWKEISRADGYIAGIGMQAIEQTRDGAIWVGNGQHNVGLNRLDPATGQWNHIRLNDVFRSEECVYSMVETPDGTLWVGGMAKLYAYRDGQWRIYRVPELPLTTAEVAGLAFANDSLWILGLLDGVQRLDTTTKHWVKYQRLNYQCETPDGTQWFISADDSVVSCKGEEWRRYGPEDGLMRWPSILLCTRGGKLWAAGGADDQAATAYFDGLRWQLKLHPAMRSRTLDYRAAIEARDGSLWFGTYVDGGRRTGDGGLLRYQPQLGPPENTNTWSHFLGGLHSTSYGFAEAAGGKLFTGSYLGLLEFDGKAWAEVPATRGQRVDALTSSADGEQLWIGTRGSGLFNYDGKSLRRYTRADGLAANSIRNVSCDSENRLWVMTGQGVTLRTEGEWITDVFAEQKIASDGGRIKRASDGSIWINQCYRSWMRRVLNGTNVDEALLNDFWTVRYVRDPSPPETEITAAMQRVAQPGNTMISWRGRDAWLRTHEGQLIFSWRLNEGPWTPFSAADEQAFLELPKGKYVFEVRSRDSDLNVDPTPARAEFIVLPPVWQQPWFIAVMAVSLVLIVTQSTRVLMRDGILRKANQALALKIEEQRRAEAQLAAKSALLEEKTQLLEREIEERKVAQGVVEKQRAELQKEIEERKRMEHEVEQVHKQLLVASRQAGMAEIAANVLHNVGNLLNSLNTSAHVLWEHVRKSKAANLKKVDVVLQENRGNLAQFLTEDERGKRLPDYVSMLTASVEREQAQIQEEAGAIRGFIEQIIDAVAKQQEYARGPGFSENIVLSELVEEAVRIAEPMFVHRKIHLMRDYSESLTVSVDRHKVVQLIGTLLSNAVHACEAGSSAAKQVCVHIRRQSDHAIVEVEDNGVGIPTENLVKIFAHGFSAQAGRHASSLHLSALIAKEMRGNLSAQSEGLQKGARFTLQLPIAS